jgi:hypothetical protein
LVVSGVIFLTGGGMLPLIGSIGILTVTGMTFDQLEKHGKKKRR